MRNKMLLNQPIKENDIVTFKLASGEEVIAKFLSEGTHTYEVSKPLVLANGPQGGMVLAPFIITAEKMDFIPILKTAAVTAPVRSQPGIRAKYIEFTTGIKTSANGENIPPLTT
jgi:hypothetical protein